MIDNIFEIAKWKKGSLGHWVIGSLVIGSLGH